MSPLDDGAFHVAFEVTMLVEQIEFCIDHHSMMFPFSSSPSADEEALLEASLVHVRLLDEFLSCSGRHPDDVRACDWAGWSPQAFLSDAMRKQINAHVAHLSSRRVIGQEWNLAQLGEACCVRLLEFFDAIPPEMLPAFFDAPKVAERGRQRFAAQLAE
jgi:hypothetical protein